MFLDIYCNSDFTWWHVFVECFEKITSPRIPSKCESCGCVPNGGDLTPYFSLSASASVIIWSPKYAGRASADRINNIPGQHRFDSGELHVSKENATVQRITASDSLPQRSARFMPPDPFVFYLTHCAPNAINQFYGFVNQVV